MASSPKIVSKKIIWIRIAENVCVCVCVCFRDNYYSKSRVLYQLVRVCACFNFFPPLPNVTWILIICICAGVWDLSSRNTTLPTLMWIQQEKCSFHFFFLGLASLLPQNKKIKMIDPLCSLPLDIICVFLHPPFSLSLSFKFPAHTQIFTWIWNIYITHTHTHTCV